MAFSNYSDVSYTGDTYKIHRKIESHLVPVDARIKHLWFQGAMMPVPGKKAHTPGITLNVELHDGRRLTWTQDDLEKFEWHDFLRRADEFIKKMLNEEAPRPMRDSGGDRTAR